MATPGEFFAAFEEAARDNPDAATQPDAVFKFVLSGENGGTWTLNLKRGASSPFVSTGDGPKEDASIHVTSDDWVALTTGEMNPMRAFMAGKVRVEGDLKLAVNLPKVVNIVEGYGIGTRGPISAAIARVRGAFSAIRRTPPSIDPMPPTVSGSLPWVGAGRALVRDPTGFFTDCRKRLGDTFVVDAFGYRLFCLFSPMGVRNLWRLPEETASKALADLTLLSHKVPIELFEGRRTLPHDLFARDDVEVYLDHLHQAVDVELSALGESGSLELFAFTKRLAHRMGLASWGGMSAASDEQLEALATQFELLDASESFVHPHKAMLAIATRKRRERRAMHAIEAIFADMLRERSVNTVPNENDLFTRICASWDDVPSPAREIGIARDVIVVQMGSQSNLFAAMAWTLIFALQHPSIVDQVRSEGDGVLDSFSHESIRMAQRSIVLRRVVSPVEVADEQTTYRIEPGTLIATMLSATNQSAAKGLDQFDENNYRGATFLRTNDLPAHELVTTYGHGKHMCPAHRFSTSAIRHSVGEIFRRFELNAEFDEPLPLPRQIGGVARADRPCNVRYLARR